MSFQRIPFLPLLLSSALMVAQLGQGGDKFETEILPLLKTQCFACHADGDKNGGVAFDKHANHAALLADRELWHRVLKNVRTGLMPPPERKKQPTPEQRSALNAWIMKDVFKVDPNNLDPGRPVLRRLNREQYKNTIRDLTGVDFRTHEEFPADDSGHGFDNIGEVLTMSPLLMEKYLAAASTIVAQAVPLTEKVMPEMHVGGDKFHSVQADATKPGPQKDVLKYAEPGVIATEVEVPEDGNYTIRFHLGSRANSNLDPDENRAMVILRVDGEEFVRKEYGSNVWKDARHETHRAWKKGKHVLTMELQRLTPEAKPKRDLAMVLSFVKILGPEDQKFWTRSSKHEKLFPQGIPEGEEEKFRFAKDWLRSFAGKAFRRPADEQTGVRLAKIAQHVWLQPDKKFEHGIARAMEAVLASPRFLFLEESVVKPTDSGHPLVDDYTLASRLSYFLWSTCPDGELLKLAAQGALRKNLESQLTRMLRHENAKTSLRNFTGQWLQVRDLASIPMDVDRILKREQEPEAKQKEFSMRLKELQGIDPKNLTPEQHQERDKLRAESERWLRRKRLEFKGPMRESMRKEAEMLVDYVLRENRPLTELLASDYVFVNQRLASHYDIAGVEGDEMRLVKLLPDSPRGGLLTQAGVLTVTSNPTRTSPVKRGLFILHNILGTPPAPPPPDIPALEPPDNRKQTEGTLRDSLAKHRADAQCASCHNRMDPLGLAFENFNALGSWREIEGGARIDPAGKLISGDSFPGVSELKQLLVSKYRQDFHRCLAEKLLTYALGRSLTWSDEGTMEQILTRLNQADGRAGTLIHAVVFSDAFLRRRM